MSEDIWSQWLKYKRFGGDKSCQAFAFDQLKKLALKIVDKAEISESVTVLDIGAGDGLVGLTALSKLGTQGKLILSDVSEAALDIPKKIFQEKQDSRVEFLVAGAEDLSSIPDSSIDRVVMRSVLLYVNDKQTAFNEIFRVIKAGGIAVIMEPINQRHLEFGTGLFKGFRLDREPLLNVQSILQKVVDELRKEYPSSLISYNEHNLVRFSNRAGFEEIKLEYSLTRTQMQFASWNFFLNAAPNPLSPTLKESLDKILTLEEFNKVEKALREVIKQPAIRTIAMALLILKK